MTYTTNYQEASLPATRSVRCAAAGSISSRARDLRGCCRSDSCTAASAAVTAPQCDSCSDRK